MVTHHQGLFVSGNAASKSRRQHAHTVNGDPQHTQEGSALVASRLRDELSRYDLELGLNAAWKVEITRGGRG